MLKQNTDTSKIKTTLETKTKTRIIQNPDNVKIDYSIDNDPSMTLILLFLFIILALIYTVLKKTRVIGGYEYNDY